MFNEPDIVNRSIELDKNDPEPKYNIIVCKKNNDKAIKKCNPMIWDEFIKEMKRSISRKQYPDDIDQTKSSLTICEGFSKAWEIKVDYKYMMTLDFDNANEEEYNHLVNYIKKYDIKHFIHNTISHNPKHDHYRFRLYIPLSTIIHYGFYSSLIESFLWDVYFNESVLPRIIKNWNLNSNLSRIFEGYVPSSALNNKKPMVDSYCLEPYSFMSPPIAKGINDLSIFNFKGNSLLNVDFFENLYITNTKKIKGVHDDIFAKYGSVQGFKGWCR